jgi:hypothetical protein
MMPPVGMRQTCYSYDVRDLAVRLGLTPRPDEWVAVEVDGDLVDVIIRTNTPARTLNDSDPALLSEDVS